VSHGSWVTRVTGQLTDGSRGSWVKRDPLSALEYMSYTVSEISGDIGRQNHNLTSEFWNDDGIKKTE